MAALADSKQATAMMPTASCERYSDDLGTTMTQRMDAKDLYRRFGGALAFVQVRHLVTKEEEIGTAFHIGEGIFVTAAHVVDGYEVLSLSTTIRTYEEANAEGWRRVICEPQDGTVLDIYRHADPRVDVACIRTDLDVAVVRLSANTDAAFELGGMLLEEIMIMGFPPVPQSAEPILICTRGEVNGTFVPYLGAPRPHLLLSPIARGGFSGSPALARTGECVGLVTSAFVHDGQVAETGFLAVLTVEPILEILRQHGILPACQSHIEQLYETLRLLREIPLDVRERGGPEPASFYVRAWNGCRRWHTFAAFPTREQALERARALVTENPTGPWTVFQIFEAGDYRRPIEEVLVPDFGALPHPRREPE